MIAEVTWDLVMGEDMDFIEGCYRLPNRPWQVVIARKRDGLTAVEVRSGLTWESGVTGVNIYFPWKAQLNAAVLLETMSRALGIAQWTEVRGPDSIVLR